MAGLSQSLGKGSAQALAEESSRFLDSKSGEANPFVRVEQFLGEMIPLARELLAQAVQALRANAVAQRQFGKGGDVLGVALAEA